MKITIQHSANDGDGAVEINLVRRVWYSHSGLRKPAWFHHRESAENFARATNSRVGEVIESHDTPREVLDFADKVWSVNM